MDNMKKHVEKYYGLKLRNEKITKYYSGSCDQCNMRKGGYKSIIYEFMPNLILIICDICDYELQSNIANMIQHLQKNTYYHTIPKNKIFSIMNDEFEIESNWIYDEKYKFNIIDKQKNILIPLYNPKTKKMKIISMRHWMIINDYML